MCCINQQLERISIILSTFSRELAFSWAGFRPAASGVRLSALQMFRIGGGPVDSFPFTGCIDEILIARTPFSADQIQKLMKDGLEKSGLLAVGSSTNQLTVTWGRIKSVR